MSKLKKLAREPWEDVLEEEEQPQGQFFRQPDVVVSDLDPYYFVLYLEQEFGKNLDGKFTRRDGTPYTQGYINNVKNGNKGVTEEFLAAVQDKAPNFQEEYQQFLDFTLGNDGNQVDPEELERLKQLSNDNSQAETNYAKFLTDVTGLNIAQLQDAMGGVVNPNESYVDDSGKTKIPKDLIKIVNNTFGIKGQDFKDWKKDNSYSVSTKKLEEIQGYYTVTANSDGKMEKKAELEEKDDKVGIGAALKDKLQFSIESKSIEGYSNEFVTEITINMTNGDNIYYVVQFDTETGECLSHEMEVNGEQWELGKYDSKEEANMDEIVSMIWNEYRLTKNFQ